MRQLTRYVTRSFIMLLIYFINLIIANLSIRGKHTRLEIKRIYRFGSDNQSEYLIHSSFYRYMIAQLPILL